MELRDFAIQILSAQTLQEKLSCPPLLTDENPGLPLLWKEPSRPPGMGFKKHTCKDKLPAFQELGHPNKRAICLHRFAGHELLAVEIMAYVLLAFPQAPKTFRKGVLHTLKEEQHHVQLYIDQMKTFGLSFGDLPLYRHFWSYVPHLKTPKEYVSLMSLTFEMANLDFAPLYGAAFARFGDLASASLMETIVKDEIRHVAFGYRWLQKWKLPEASEWETWVASLPYRVTPSRAKGFQFFEENRRMCGLSEDWIENLKRC